MKDHVKNWDGLHHTCRDDGTWSDVPEVAMHGSLNKKPSQRLLNSYGHKRRINDRNRIRCENKWLKSDLMLQLLPALLPVSNTLQAWWL
jgi:hypothetical protein